MKRFSKAQVRPRSRDWGTGVPLVPFLSNLTPAPLVLCPSGHPEATAGDRGCREGAGGQGQEAGAGPAEPVQ